MRPSREMEFGQSIEEMTRIVYTYVHIYPTCRYSNVDITIPQFAEGWADEFSFLLTIASPQHQITIMSTRKHLTSSTRAQLRRSLNQIIIQGQRRQPHPR